MVVRSRRSRPLATVARRPDAVTRRRRRRRLLLGAVTVGALAGALAAARAERRWRDAPDPCGPDGLRLPEGEERTVTTRDGAEISVTVAGSGPTVVLSHCYTGSRGVWAPVARRLVAAGRQVVLYDQRGHGRSTVGGDGCTIEAIGDDLAAVLEQLDLHDVVLAGHSLGGMTIQAFLATHTELARERVRAIVLVATAASGVGSPALATFMGGVLASPQVEAAMRSARGHALVRHTVGRRPSHAALVATRDALVNTEAQVRRDFLTALYTMDLTEGLGEIDVPTTVVVGDRDRLTPPRLGRALAAAIPDTRLVEWPDHGHMLPLEAPDEVAELLAEASV